MEDLKLLLMFCSATFAFIGLALVVRNRYYDKRTAVRVECDFAHQLISEGGNFLKGSTPFLSVKVKNIGASNRFINKPSIELSRKISGYKTFCPAKLNDSNTYPHKLEAGDVYNQNFNLFDFDSQLGSQLQDSDWIRFVIEDTMGRFHRSSKLRIKKIREQISIARDL